MKSIVLFISLCVQITHAYNNGAPGSRLPVLGWSSWVALGPGSNHPIFDYCDEESVKQSADAFVSLGFKDAGYTGFHLDDCWADVNRNESGYLQGELDHFPNGMKTVVDHVHKNGMDFGLYVKRSNTNSIMTKTRTHTLEHRYTCAETHTCVGGRPGSKDHWEQDANVFAEWGVDWVKQDNCNTDGMGKPEDYYKFMSDALNKTGRSICFAMCEWGNDSPWTWGYDLAQSWRATGDHTCTWSSTKKIIAESAAIPKEYTGKQYGWNDLDMLETGNYEQAAHANGKESNMTATEYKTEFSIWAISASPLVVTTPIMNCSAGYVSDVPHPNWGTELEDSTSCTISLKKQFSNAECTLGTSFGCFDGNHSMWTDHGCRGQFVVDGATVLCDTDGSGRHYCGQVACTP